MPYRGRAYPVRPCRAGDVRRGGGTRPFVKILFHHRIASRDGQAVHMDELRRALVALGHTVVLVGPSRTARLKFGDDDRPVALLTRLLPRALYQLLAFAYNLLALPRLP